MSDPKPDIVAWRLSKADEAYAMAGIAAVNKYWASAVSELYYTCFYLSIALFAKYDIKAATHAGVKSALGAHFITKGVLEARWGKLFSHLFGMRQDGDYGDFVIYSENDVKPLLNEVKEFMDVMKQLIAK